MWITWCCHTWPLCWSGFSRSLTSDPRRSGTGSGYWEKSRQSLPLPWKPHSSPQSPSGKGPACAPRLKNTETQRSAPSLIPAFTRCKGKPVSLLPLMFCHILWQNNAKSSISHWVEICRQSWHNDEKMNNTSVIWDDGIFTKSGVDVSDGLVHGHVDQAPPQAEVRQHQQAFLQPLVEHQQRLAAERHAQRSTSTSFTFVITVKPHDGK